MRRLIVFVLAALLVACGGDDDAGPQATVALNPSPTSTATPAPRSEATPTSPAATVVAAPTPVPDGALFLESRRRPADRQVTLPPRSEWPFEAWDGQSIVVYDTLLGTATNLGPGSLGGFSPEGRLLAYRPGRPGSAEVRVRDLASGTDRSLQTTGTPVGFGDDRRLIIAGQDAFILDIETGQRLGIDAITDPELRFRLDQILRPSGAVMLGESLVSRMRRTGNSIPPGAPIGRKLRWSGANSSSSSSGP